MPALAVAGAGIATAIGATGAAAAVVSATFVGAVVGAAIGAATSLMTGGNVLEGALKGAGMGAVGGAVTGAVGAAVQGVGEAGLAASEAGVSGVGADVAATEAAIVETGGGAASGMSGAAPVGSAAQVGAQTGQAVTPQANKGLLSGVAKWAGGENGAEVLGRTVAQGASSMLDARSQEKQLKAVMERDRLALEGSKISGLTTMDFKTALPTIGAFTDKPTWEMPNTGLLWKGAQDGTAKPANA